eukprot:COSAG02_NODE_6368_length_3621_cov_1.933844_6_plen_340_part_00
MLVVRLAPTSALAVVVVLQACCIPTDAGRIVAVRGAPPAAWASFFDAEGIYTCDGGARKLAKNQVNDDFCDCDDGTDEPGTAACALVDGQASFFCRNDGFPSATVFASHVNDGVCDCCDGSDEWNSGATCSNTCAAAAAASGDDARKEAALDPVKMRLGALARKSFVAGARAARESGELFDEPGVFGSDDAYYALKGQCYDIVSGVFTYTVCPFGKSFQSEMRKKTKEWEAGKHEILIGNWAGFDSAEPHTMIFSGGEKCSDTLSRSLRVAVTCGSETKITSEQEPSVCQYTMRMQSPAACDATTLAAANLDPEGNPVVVESAPKEAKQVDEIVYHDEL